MDMADAATCAHGLDGDTVEAVRESVARAIRVACHEEREACATIADEARANCVIPAMMNVASTIAALIRSQA